MYWLIESNEDTSITVIDLSTCQTIIEAEIESRPQDELEGLQFTITPTFMTKKQFEELPEFDG